MLDISRSSRKKQNKQQHNEAPAVFSKTYMGTAMNLITKNPEAYESSTNKNCKGQSYKTPAGCKIEQTTS